MADQTDFTEREEIEMLLPWYAMGTLSATDRARVERYIADNPDFAREVEAHLALIETERRADVEINEAIRVPASLSVDRLLSQATPPVAARVQAGARSIWSQLADLFSAPTAGAVRFAAAAAVAIILAQAVAIGTMVSKAPAPGGYELASGGKAQPVSGTLALIKLADGTDVATALTQLRSAGLVIVDGPAAGGLLTVRVAEEKLDKPARDSRFAQIRSAVPAIILITPKGN